jgi:hypothetical protein
MVQVRYSFRFRMGFIERSPNHGQEFIRLNRFRQESSGTRKEYTFFVRPAITPR